MPNTPTETPVTLDEAIAFVGRLHPNTDPLVQLEDAVVVGERLERLSDELVGHFVQQARDEGATWSLIGESMGVSKQAAQKRFVANLGAPDAGVLSRFTQRARNVLKIARDDAQRRGAAEVGTAHLVFGLVSDPGGLAMQALTDMGVTAANVRAALDAAAPTPAANAPSLPSFAAESRTVLQVSVEEAVHLGHNYVGTEHLLLAVLADRDTRGARVLTELGVTRRKASMRIKKLLEQIVKERITTA